MRSRGCFDIPSNFSSQATTHNNLHVILKKKFFCLAAMCCILDTPFISVLLFIFFQRAIHANDDAILKGIRTYGNKSLLLSGHQAALLETATLPVYAIYSNCAKIRCFQAWISCCKLLLDVGLKGSKARKWLP